MRLKILTVILLALFAGYLYQNPLRLHLPDTSLAEGLIEDNAHVFKQDETDYILEYHAMLLDRFDLDYRIITVNGQDNINRYAAEVFNERKIGEKSRNKRGLLLVIDVKNNQVRLEVSASLESVYTDAFVAYLENRQMIQFFKVGRIADGIFATSEIIRIRAIDAQKGHEFDDSKFAGSIGGGATTGAQIGAGKDTSFQEDQPEVLAADTPEETLRRYLRALENRNGRDDLDAFTPDTRKFMATMLSTPAQMDNSYKRYKTCKAERVTYNEDKTRAVLFHPLERRDCDPFLFEKGEDRKWRLDLKALGLGTNHTFGNIWYVHFGRQEESGFWKYFFGFKHVWFNRPDGENGRFDHQGIPYYHRYGIFQNHVGEEIRITKVNKDGFIDKIGLRAGDRILEWEGIRFMHSAHFGWRLKEVRPGLDIYIKIQRDGKIIEKIAKAPPHPDEGELRFGFSYKGFSPRLNDQAVRLPVVHYVDAHGSGKDLGIMPGDLIRKWQDIELPNMMDIKKSN